MPDLKLHNLTVEIGRRPLFKNLELSLEGGKLTLLTGRNGSGKSTLLDCLTGFHRSYSGTVTLNGEGIDGLGPSARARRGLTRTFQTPRLFHGLSVADHMALGHRASQNAIRSYFQEFRATISTETAEALNLLNLMDRPVSELSFGEMKLVNIARALQHANRLHVGEGVVLLDEPLASLHGAKRRRVLEALREQKERGSALLVIEHDENDIFELADRWFDLRDGDLLKKGFK